MLTNVFYTYNYNKSTGSGTSTTNTIGIANIKNKINKLCIDLRNVRISGYYNTIGVLDILYVNQYRDDIDMIRIYGKEILVSQFDNKSMNIKVELTSIGSKIISHTIINNVSYNNEFNISEIDLSKNGIVLWQNYGDCHIDSISIDVHYRSYIVRHDDKYYNLNSFNEDTNEYNHFTDINEITDDKFNYDTKLLMEDQSNNLYPMNIIVKK